MEDYYSQKKSWWLRLHEKNGKVNEMPCHHKLEAYRTVKLSDRPMLRGDVWSRNAKTTELYDRLSDDISVGEVERIGI